VPPATMLLLPALNAMMDITTTRTLATSMYPPMSIFVMLIGLALASALLAGYAMAGSPSHPWLHMQRKALGVREGHQRGSAGRRGRGVPAELRERCSKECY
jgi:hypothetical protein